MEGSSFRRYPNRIKQFRLEKGLTQRELARVLGYKSVSSLSHMEAGKKLPSIRTAIKLEIALQRFIGDIFPRLYRETRTPVARRREKLYKERGITGGW